MEKEFYLALNQLLNKENLAGTEEQADLLYKHWQLLSVANQSFNLTAITGEEEALEKHYFDSLMLLSCLKEDGPLLDIGSGAGFPGIPLAVMQPERSVVLLEATEKRARFLNEVKTQLSLTNVSVEQARAEKAARDSKYRGKFTYVTARAVSSLSVLLEYAMPFLKPGGVFLAMKGPTLAEEVAKAQNAFLLLNAELEKVMEYRLPNSGDKRTLAIIRKNGETSEKYPRREGKPEKAPL